jgi:hypothetical protein
VSHLRASLLVLALGLTPAVAAAAEPAPAGAPLPSDPVFSALRTDGTTVSGRLRRFGASGEVAIVPAEGAEQVIPLDRLVKLTRDGAPPAASPEGSLVILPDGDRLYRTVIGPASETAIDVQPNALGNLAIPLESLLGLVLSPPGDSDAMVALIDRVRAEPRSSEVLWLANGDRLAGGFLGIDDRKVKFQPGGGGAGAAVELDRAGVVALGFDPALVVYPKPKADYVELTMADGSRLGVTGPRLEQGQVVATTRFGATIRVALAELAKVHARTASVSYLSEREASATQYVGFVGPPRPYRRDATVDGHPLRLSGQTFDRGLGTQSRTLLAYRLSPGDRRFQATVGLDETAGPLGNVVFRVLVDNRERFVSPPMSARDTPKVIDIDVSGAKIIILATEFGERGGVRDIADWAEARIIR